MEHNTQNLDCNLAIDHTVGTCLGVRPVADDFVRPHRILPRA